MLIESARSSSSSPSLPAPDCPQSPSSSGCRTASCLWDYGEWMSPTPSQWPDTYVARLQALALLQTLHAQILASTSATRALETWCRAHRLAHEPKIVIERLPSRPARWEPEHQRWLSPSPEETVTHRKVRLRCGRRILAEADNWYVPNRLTPEINRVLETTDTPFGTAITSLDPYRRTTAVELMWSPLPTWWDDTTEELPDGPTLTIPESLFQHRAVIYASARIPISFVEETYKRSLLPDQPRRRSDPAP